MKRAENNASYGCILIPEGLLMKISSFKTLISEMNKLFASAENQEAIQARFGNDNEARQMLTPWSFALYSSLPDFFKKLLVAHREVYGTLKFAQIDTEKLLAYLCDQELKRRKAAGTYKGTFAPVTHYFGYQGRSGHPSLFDCSLGSTCGFAAGAMVEAGLTGLAVAVRQVT